MKVLSIVFLLIAAVSAGSGPYLPSGWRPSGPAFLLPSEVQKPADNPLKETLQVEAEGSDFLREYGPPKVVDVSQDLTKQDLPSVSTEQAFAEIENEVTDSEVSQSFEVASEVTKAETTTASDETEDNEATTELVQTVVEEVQSVTEVTAEVEEKSAAVEIAVEDNVEQTVVENETENVIEGRSFSQTEAEEETTVVSEETEKAVTESVQEQITETTVENENANSDIVSAVEEKEEVFSQVAEREGKSVEEVVTEVKESGVQNIADALIKLEGEVKAGQVQEVAEVRTGQENSGSTAQNLPEGFLEYGPPGFREYGPPKDLLRSADNAEPEAVESNETRRRRFSPKFQSRQ